MDDKRFSRFATDPKFRPVPKKQRKVKIDARFKSMFEDERFSSKVGVDKRGRPHNFSAKENYKKYYSVQDEGDGDNETDDDDQILSVKAIRDAVERKKKKKKEEEEEEVTAAPSSRGKNKSSSQDLEGVWSTDYSQVEAKPKKTAGIRSKLKDLSVDYARGEGFLVSGSSSSSEDPSSSSEEEDEEPEMATEGFDKWGELDHDAERTGEVSKCLAVCNLDWDRVNADDIFLALSSFCPEGGRVDSVRVYPSEFGKKRLADEERLGPEELRIASNDVDGDVVGEFEDSEEIEKAATERVRKYQVNKLRYYYAIAEFSDEKTATSVYEACDGNEYELSATRFDLRFVPDDMTFDDQEPHQVCNTIPDPEKYKPKIFFNTALMQGKANLTWDETDPERLTAMQKAFDDFDASDAKAYIACSSSDEEDGRKDEDEDRSGEEVGEEDDDEEKTVSSYRALLSEIRAKEDKEKKEKGEMEVTWTVRSSSSAAKKEQKPDEQEETLTPWEKYLKKTKDKRKAKREKRKGEKEESSKTFSDDELPEDFGFDKDPFFNEQDSDEDLKPPGKKRKKIKNKGREEEGGHASNDLSLLVMDSDDEKDHFDYSEIVKNESKKKGKKSKKGSEDAKERPDNFKINLGDDRFSALFGSADFHVDPSHPKFKKTKSMQEIVDEKQRRIVGKKSASRGGHQVQDLETSKSNKSLVDQNTARTKRDLEKLIVAVKSKTKRSRPRSKK